MGPLRAGLGWFPGQFPRQTSPEVLPGTPCPPACLLFSSSLLGPFPLLLPASLRASTSGRPDHTMCLEHKWLQAELADSDFYQHRLLSSRLLTFH